KSLEDYCKKYAVNYFLDDSTWLYFSDLLKEIPVKTYNQEDYLKYNRFIEMEDSTYTYFLNIKDFEIKESVSPLSFEKNNVRKIILNKRKLELVEEIEESIFNDALKNEDFEIY
ncbi:MAG: peptidyl-prolyl cis-trans isomerase, partial [Bacteroidota bacterium]